MSNNVMSLNQSQARLYALNQKKRSLPVDMTVVKLSNTKDEASVDEKNDTSEMNDGEKRVDIVPTASAEQMLDSGENGNNSVKRRKKIKRDEDNAVKGGLGGLGGIIGSGVPLGANYLQVRPKNRLDDLAGVDSALNQIKDMVFYPLRYPKVYELLGVRAPCGLLLHGPSGCGKTALALSIAGELGLPFYKASGPELVGGTSGESEERIRDVFNTAIANTPSVLFIDQIDVIAGKKDVASQRGMDRRIIAQLSDSIDAINNLDHESEEGEEGKREHLMAESSESGATAASKPLNIVILIAATNKADNLDTSVRGRFAREIALPVPDAVGRTKILKLLTAKMSFEIDVDFDVLGKVTPGYVGTDLKTLVREAGMNAVSRIVAAAGGDDASVDAINASSSCAISMNDFMVATKSIQPTAKREGFAVVPDVTWDDVGALAEIREELLHNVLEPIANPEKFKSLGLDIPAGVLFFGPPGCGKTLLAKAIANQSGANFISVKGPELLNMYVGESESRVRQVFSRARSSAPCVIFFDELDALCPKRGGGIHGSGSGDNVSERVVNQLLTELDGLESRKDVYIIAATNRLELIDDAMLRPGRLGKLLYVPLPNSSDRTSILTALTVGSKGKIKISFDAANGGVDISKVMSDVRSEGFSGADIANLLREAGLAVIREWYGNSEFGNSTSNNVIMGRHFEEAFTRVRPSVSLEDRKRYEKVHEYIKAGMGPVQALAAAKKQH